MAATPNSTRSLARNFLVAKQGKANGLIPEKCPFSEDIRLHHRHYTKKRSAQPGREIATVCGRLPRKWCARTGNSIDLTEKLVQEYSGVPNSGSGGPRKRTKSGWPWPCLDASSGGTSGH